MTEHRCHVEYEDWGHIFCGRRDCFFYPECRGFFGRRDSTCHDYQPMLCSNEAQEQSIKEYDDLHAGYAEMRTMMKEGI